MSAQNDSLSEMRATLARMQEEHARAQVALREESRLLEILNQTGQSIASQLDIEKLLQTVTDAATSLTGAHFGAFFYNRVNEAGEDYLLYTLSGAPRAAFEKFGHPRATAVFAPTFRGEGTVLSDDITKDPRYGTMPPHHGMPPGHLPVCSYLAVPVKSRSGDVFGGLFLGHPDSARFRERDARLVEGVAAQAAIAIDNARLYESAQAQLATRERAEASLRDSDRRKDEFLATLAHELRNPLAPVRTAAHLLAQAAHDPARVAWASEVIQRQVGHMGRLLEDLMDVARITRGRLTLQPQDVSLGDIVRSALESVQDAIDARGHVLEVDMPAPDAPVRLDPVRMSQVLSNLLANAAKYTDRGGRITLSARIEGSDAVLRVADTGIGLEPDRIDSIFDMFSQREEALSRAEGGLGIGLALVRGLVELHGGRVQASSEGPGKGSAFTVRVPAGHVQREAGTTAGDGAATKPLSILVADDNHDAADMLAALLGLGGHDVTIVYSGEDAIAQARRAPPDVALLDIGMPDISGYDVVIALREFLPAPGPHIAALSGWGRPEDQGRALAAGFDRHFTKPVDAGALLEWLATVATACRRSD